MITRQYFHVAGSTNTIVYDTGITSTQAEKKRIVSVSLLVDEVADNQVQAYHERAKIFDIPDRLIDVENGTGSVNLSKPGLRINEIEVGLDIPVGETFKVAIKCGATATDIYGTYNYELIQG
jgi:hypothetical protein